MASVLRSLIVILGSVTLLLAEPAIESFSTSGHTVYHLQPATVDKTGVRSIISAAYDGTVLCHRQDGTLLWRSQTNGFFPFDLEVADIDQDGLDEALIASSDGTLYAYDHDGQLLWKFSKEPPLYQVAVARSEGGSMTVLAGGIERVLYSLDPSGKVRGSLQLSRVVRDISTDRFSGGDKSLAAVVTTESGRSDFFLQLYDPATLRPLWAEDIDLDRALSKGARVRVFSLISADLNRDGIPEIVMSISTGNSADLAAFDGKGRAIPLSSCSGVRRRPYRMNLLTSVERERAEESFILGAFGADLIVYNLDGTCRSVHSGPDAPANLAFDPQSSTCLLASGISGGDRIYQLHIDREGWGRAFEQMAFEGDLARIQQNLSVLSRQIQSFVPPHYQPSPKPTDVYVQQRPEEIQQIKQTSGGFEHVTLSSYEYFVEHYEPQNISNPKWLKEFEQRHSTGLSTQEEVLEYAKQREARGESFVVWAGHGRIFGIDFYLSMETLERLLKAAPRTLKGFVFAELENLTEPTKQAIQTQLIPLADLCRKYGGKKILLRNKNIFWNGSVYHPNWWQVFRSGEYKDIFVPSMEETNSRTQELSLAGRVGLWMTGYFDRFSARVVTDNADYSRMWEWGQQQILSHHIRSLVYQASQGADLFHINLYQGNYDDLVPFYQMLEKGIVLIPRRDDLLSLSSLYIGMREPSPNFLEHGTNGHHDTGYEASKGASVFERLDSFWGGAPIPDHDLTAYAYGSRSRMLNFLPSNPFGLVPMGPDEQDIEASGLFKEKVSTDGEFFYDRRGKKLSATDYQPVVERLLRDASERLSVRVEGGVAWSVVRVDPTHVRVILLDSGYLDPAERQAAIILQNLKGLECRDILSREEIPIEGNRVEVTVPLGVFRIFDIAHRPLDQN